MSTKYAFQAMAFAGALAVATLPAFAADMPATPAPAMPAVTSHTQAGVSAGGNSAAIGTNATVNAQKDATSAQKSAKTTQTKAQKTAKSTTAKAKKPLAKTAQVPSVSGAASTSVQH